MVRLSFHSDVIVPLATGASSYKDKRGEPFAVRSGLDYVVTGSKMWTSRVQHSDWMLLLVRTTPLDQCKRRTDGLSLLLIDLREAGDRSVALASLGARQRVVRNLADRHVAERVRLVTFDVGLRLTADVLPGFKRAQRLVEPRGRVELREHRPPERSTHDRRIQKEPALTRDQAIEEARTAGFLGDVSALKGGIASLTGQPDAMGGREVGGLANQLAAHMGFSPPEVDRVRRMRIGLEVRDEAFDRRGRAGRLGADRLDAPPDRRFEIARLEELRAAGNDLQRIVDVVGGAGQRAHDRPQAVDLVERLVGNGRSGRGALVRMDGHRVRVGV